MLIKEIEEFKNKIESLNKELKEKDSILKKYKITLDYISNLYNEKFENLCQKSKYVNQIMIYGNYYINGLIAIIKPNINYCLNYFKIKESELKKMTENKILKNLIINDLEKILNKYFIDIIIDFEGFTLDNYCLTPTLKLIRCKIINLHKQQIINIYKKISLENKNKIKESFQYLKKDFLFYDYDDILNINI